MSNHPTPRPVRPTLIPYPQSLVYEDGKLPLLPPFWISAPETFTAATHILAGELSRFGEVRHAAGTAGTGTAISLQIDSSSADEAYQLSIAAGGVTITGGEQGLHYAIATLRQLLLQTPPGDASLPLLKITDQPRYSWRGALLDCSRHFLSKDTVLRFIDRLALFKINRFHWHLTDDQGWRLESKTFPRLTEVGAWRGPPHARYGGYYTQEEVREIVAAARARGIVVVPELDMPGHATAMIAAYPELGCGSEPVEVETRWGIMQQNLDPGREETFHFLEKLFDEVVDLFPDPWVHLGADECMKEPWKQSESCQRRIREEGLQDERELQTWFLNRALKLLAERDRVGIGWDEVLEGGLPENIIVQSWQDQKFSLEAARLGAKVIAAPLQWCYLNYSTQYIDLARAHSFSPCPDDADDAIRENILGGECTLWTEYIDEDTLDHLTYPRLLAIAEALWKPGGATASYDHFHTRLNRFYPILDQLGIDYGPAHYSSHPGHRPFGRRKDFRELD